MIVLCNNSVKQYDIKALSSHHDDADIFGLAGGHFPVVQVMVQFAVADLEHEVFEDTLVLAYLSHIKHIETVLLSHNQRIFEKGFQTILRVVLSDTVGSVSNVDFVMLGVVQNV